MTGKAESAIKFYGSEKSAQLAAEIVGLLDDLGVQAFVGYLHAGTALHLADLLSEQPDADEPAIASVQEVGGES